MNVPSFTGSNNAEFFFFVSVYKISQSRQGDGLDGDEGGWRTINPFTIAELQYLYINRFLKPRSMSSYSANQLAFSGQVRNIQITRKPLNICHNDASCIKSYQCPSLQQVHCTAESRRPIPVHTLGCTIVLHSVILSQCNVFVLFFFSLLLVLQRSECLVIYI